LDDPAANGRSATGDYAERKCWGDYTKAYEDALSATSTKHSPWFIIPANHKWFRNLAVSRIVVETLQSLEMKFPQPVVKHPRDQSGSTTRQSRKRSRTASRAKHQPAEKNQAD